MLLKATMELKLILVLRSPVNTIPILVNLFYASQLLQEFLIVDLCNPINSQLDFQSNPTWPYFVEMSVE